MNHQKEQGSFKNGVTPVIILFINCVYRLELLIEYGQVIASISAATHSLNEDDIDTEHKPGQQPNIITLSAASNNGAGLLSSVIKLMESLN